jgi:two-component system, NarL family, sensor histidine kinase UhpB
MTQRPTTSFGQPPTSTAALAAGAGPLAHLTQAQLLHWQQFAAQMAAARSLNELGQRLTRAALEVTGARSARLLLLLPTGELETNAVANAVGVSSLLGASLGVRGLGFETITVAEQRSPAHLSLRQSLQSRQRQTNSDGLSHWPLCARERVAGVLELLPEPGAKNSEAQSVAQAAAQFQAQVAAEAVLGLYLPLAALALEASRLNGERSRREREARSLADLARRIGGTLELDEILDETLRFAVRSLGLERGILTLYDDVRESTAIGRHLFTVGFGERLNLPAGQEPSLTISPESFERLIKRNQPIVANDVRASSRSYAAGPRELGAEAFLMVPLAARAAASQKTPGAGHKPLGVLYLDTTRSGFDIRERAVAMAQALAEQASLAIENARLYAEESRKRNAAEALRTVILALGASLNLPEIIEQILSQAQSLMGAAACAIFETDERTSEVAIRTALGLENEHIRALRFPWGMGAVGQSLQSRQSVQINDLYSDDTPRPASISALLSGGDFPYRGLLALPLVARGQVVGGLALYFSDTLAEEHLASDDLETLELFAGHAALALDNAKLFEEEVRREREAQILVAVARLAGGTLKLDEVLSLVAVKVTEALNLERCFIGFFDEIDEQNQVATIGRLYAQGFDTDLEAYRPFMIAEAAFAQLIEEREPIVFNDLGLDDSLSDQPPAALLGAQACVIAPLVAQGQVLGMLYADTTYSGDQVDGHGAGLASAIADQAALAIQNARLFEASERQEAKYRLLAESAHDLIVTTDLEGRISYVNPAVTRVLGYAPEALFGQPFQQLLDGEGVLLAGQVWQRVVASSASSAPASANVGIYEAQALREDGSQALLEVNLNALRVDGALIGSLSVARDLSEKQALMAEIAERGRDLAREETRSGEMRSFLSLFTQAQEEERRRIARELHDDTAQTLVAITRRLDRLGGMMEKIAAGSLSLADGQARLADIRGDLDYAIDSVRRFARNLRPSVLDDLGLVPALEWLVGQARTATRLELRGPELGRMASDLELTLFRVVQEALTNVDKHAQASHATVRLHRDPDGLAWPAHAGRPGLQVTVEDDGLGFRAHDDIPSEALPSTNPNSEQPSITTFTSLASLGHLGLAGMFERVALAGGAMQLTSASGRGSALVFWFPI